MISNFFPIPILEALFEYHTRAINKKETVLFLTPHVISDLGESNRMTQEFREKTHSIQKELEKQRKEQEKRPEKQPTQPAPQGSKGNPSPPREAVTETRSTLAISP